RAGAACRLHTRGRSRGAMPRGYSGAPPASLAATRTVRTFVRPGRKPGPLPASRRGSAPDVPTRRLDALTGPGKAASGLRVAMVGISVALSGSDHNPAWFARPWRWLLHAR